MKKGLLQSGSRLWIPLLALLLLLGAVLRLIHLTAPPLDFQPVRQLRNLIVARDIYYNLQPHADPQKLALANSFANAVGRYEPPITEGLIGWTFTWTGGENIAVARIYESLFWLLAGLALFDLARRIASPTAGLIALAYYLVLPFAVQASRSFQPDPLMTAAFFSGFYFLYRWTEERSWKWAVLAGLLMGFAALVKIVIAYFIIGAAVAAVLAVLGLRFWRSFQVWAMAALVSIPAFGYYVLGHPGRSSEYFFSWTVDLVKLITTTSFYAHWLGFLGSLFSLVILFLSLAGALLAPPRLRWMLIGVWVGYVAYGLTLPFQMFTHSYYHIQLIPVVALGLAPVVQALIDRLSNESRWFQLAAAGLVVFVIGYQSWVARSEIIVQDYRQEPVFWAAIGRALPENSNIIGLTQDYGYRLMYYGWRKVDLWPYVNELTLLKGSHGDAQSNFADAVAGKDYFLVTAFGQLDQQPELKKILSGYQIAAQGNGYVLYDLRLPK